MSQSIVVTGGSGLVGRHLKDIIPTATFVSSKDYDLRSEDETKRLFNDYKPSTVVHLAARVGGIVDNIEKPVEYLDDNVLINTNILKHSYINGVSRFIGVLSTCAYPDVCDHYPMLEEDIHSGPPTSTNFGYGYAKRLMAVQIDTYNKQYGTNYNYLIPCNLYSEYDNFVDEKKMHFITSLLYKIKNCTSDAIEFYGSGKALRQYLYAGDFARVIKHTIDNDITHSFNVAHRDNLSIDTMIKRTFKALNIKKNYIYSNNGLDGQYRKDVSIDKFESLIPNFKFTSFDDGIKHVYAKIK